MGTGMIVFLAVVVFIIANSVRILREYERGVVFRLGRFVGVRTGPWGVKISAVEVRDVNLPENMKRAIAKQAEAERERRAKVIHADGEFQASSKLKDAADIMAVQPVAVQLRYLQTLTEIATEKNSTVVFPLPMDLLAYFMKSKTKES